MRGLVFSILFVLSASPAIASDWNREFQELCARDKKCHMLLTYQHRRRKTVKVWRTPSIGTMLRICKRSDSIKRAAIEFSMPAKTIAACLFSERTFLVDLFDYLADLAARYGRGLSRDPSLGLTQMRISTARKIQQDTFGTTLSDQRIAKILLNDHKALRLMSALLAQYRTIYQKENLSRGSDILCSLYLIGKADERAAQHAKNRTTPQSNFYGFFAQMHEELADRALNTDCSYRSIQELRMNYNQMLTQPASN